jgi:phosphatidylglycerol:prolipoprotein diacylglycerol transferase
LLSVYRARQVGLDPEIILSLATWFFVSGIVGARLFYIIEYWPKFQRPTIGETLARMVNLAEGGLVVYGSLLAGGAALLIFIHRNRLPGLAFADLIAPGVVLGVGIGRIGCFLNGCCYGGITDVPWAVRFPPTSPAFADQATRGELYLHGLIFRGAPTDPPILDQVEPDSPPARQGLTSGERVIAINGERVGTVEEAQWMLLKSYGSGTQVSVQVSSDRQAKSWPLEASVPRSRPVHPTQLYSLIDALLLCLFLLAFEPYKRREGELTALVLTIHPISRFLLEMIRVDEAAVFNTGMSISQNISIAIFLGGLLLWAYLFLRRPSQAVWPVTLATG